MPIPTDAELQLLREQGHAAHAALMSAYEDMALVRTKSGPSGDTFWGSGANRGAVQWDSWGHIVAVHDSHGLCAEVRHRDGSVVCYNDCELDLAPARDPSLMSRLLAYFGR